MVRVAASQPQVREVMINAEIKTVDLLAHSLTMCDCVSTGVYSRLLVCEFSPGVLSLLRPGEEKTLTLTDLWA